MKKLLGALAGALLSIGLMTGVAAAQSSIGTTGPGSNNQINTNQTNTSVQTCTNTVRDTNTNVQGANSGTSNTSGNTVGGSAQSGTAGNTNSTSTNVNVGGCGSNCTTCGQTPGGGTTTTGSTPGGQGGGTVSGVSTTASVAGVTALPATGSSTILAPLGIGAVVLGGLAVAAQLGISGYRRLTLR